MKNHAQPPLAPTTCVVCQKEISSGIACPKHLDEVNESVANSNAGIPTHQHSSGSEEADNRVVEIPLGF